MRHQDAQASRERTHGVFGFYSSSSKGQTGGPEPKDLSIGTASRHQNQHLHRLLGTMSVRAHMPICCSAKLAAARRRLERAAQYTPTVSCLCPSQVVVARSRELAIRERRASNQPREGSPKAAPGPLGGRGGRPGPALCARGPTTRPRARKAAQRQPAARASSDNVLRRDRRLHVRQRRHGRAQVQVPAARRGAPDEYQT